MKIRTLLVAGAIGFNLLGAVGTRELLAQSSTPPPIVVPPNKDDRGLIKDLKGAPDDVKTLVMSFDSTRDGYLKTQAGLLAQLKSATTAAERDALRKALQANRDAFLAELKTFRTQLMDDLKAVKGKISHAEFQRIITAAHDAATEGARHKGGK